MTTDAGPLGAPYRTVRAVRARDDGPWPGVLVRTGAGETRVLVDADVLGADWTGWDAASDDHVLAPLDIARRDDGHDVVLPVCVERLQDFVRRRAARMPLSAGEAVTLGVSVLRGCARIASSPETTGEWWLDDAGRPVLATEASGARALDGAAAALRQVPVDARLQRAWDTALRAIGADRVVSHELLEAEEALFTIAVAEPLSTVALTSPGVVDGAARSRDLDDAGAAQTAHRSLWHALVAGVDDDLADTVSRATTALWRRLRPGGADARPKARRAPWIVGGTVAAAVLAGGALWPAASGAEPPGGATTPAPSHAPEPGGDTGAGAVGADESGGAEAARPGKGVEPPPAVPADTPPDLAATGSALLDARLACAAAAQCLTSVVVDAAAAFPAGVVDLPASDRSVTLLDDFGDLAVLRVDPRDATLPAQLVVMLRRDAEWLLRDVHDVAQQP